MRREATSRRSSISSKTDSSTSTNWFARTTTPCLENVEYQNSAIIDAFPFCFKDYGGWTALIWAAEFSNTEVARFLMSVGSAPTIRDKVAPSSTHNHTHSHPEHPYSMYALQEGNTGLHWAAVSGCVETARAFIAAGCDVDEANENGDRPLCVTLSLFIRH